MFGLRRGRLAPSQIMIFIVQLGPSLKLKLWTKANTIITVNICCSDFSPDLHLTLGFFLIFSLRILKMGWLSKFISLRSIPYCLGDTCAALKPRWASPQGLWLWNFDNHPIFKIAILRRENFVVQSAAKEWSSMQKIIVLMRWLFWPESRSIVK